MDRILLLISPDGRLDAPLQAAGFALVAGLGLLLAASFTLATVRRFGIGRATAQLASPPALAAMLMLPLVALNLWHHAVAPLDGVFRPEVGDGGLVENLTIAMMLIPPLAFLAGRAGWLPRGTLGPGFMIAISAVLLLAFGEEVSWGQHWFGYTPPEAIATTNLQAEFNLHNYVTPNAMEVAYFLAALLMLLLAARLGWLLQTRESDGDLLGLRVLFVAGAVLMSHHVFQELAELAVIAAGLIIWTRLQDRRLVFAPAWLRGLSRR